MGVAAVVLRAVPAAGDRRDPDLDWLYQPDIGLLQHLLGALGLEPVGWLTDESVAMWSVAAVTVWWTVGFNFLLYLAALQGSLPQRTTRPRRIDGAGRLAASVGPSPSRSCARITVVIVMLQILASLKVFDQIYMLTKGGPNGSTRPILEYVYDIGFTDYRLGYASAISYVFFALDPRRHARAAPAARKED